MNNKSLYMIYKKRNIRYCQKPNENVVTDKILYTVTSPLQNGFTESAWTV